MEFINKEKLNDIIAACLIVGGSAAIGYKFGKEKGKYNKEADKIISTFSSKIAEGIQTEKVEKFIKYINSIKLTSADLLLVKQVHDYLKENNVEDSYLKDIRLVMEMNGYKKVFKVTEETNQNKDEIAMDLDGYIELKKDA